MGEFEVYCPGPDVWGGIGTVLKWVLTILMWMVLIPILIIPIFFVLIGIASIGGALAGVGVTDSGGVDIPDLAAQDLTPDLGEGFSLADTSANVSDLASIEEIPVESANWDASTGKIDWRPFEITA